MLTFLPVLFSLLIGYLFRTLQVYFQKSVLIEQELQAKLDAAQKLSEMTQKRELTLQLACALLAENKSLERRLSDLQAQHERTLASLN